MKRVRTGLRNLICFLMIFLLTGCTVSDRAPGSGQAVIGQSQSTGTSNHSETASAGTHLSGENVELSEIEEYSGTPYVILDDNIPGFTEDEITDESFEEYSELDILGRCGTAVASVGSDLMPTEKRGSISEVQPSGWQSVQYDFVDGESLYNRCHLAGYRKAKR